MKYFKTKTSDDWIPVDEKSFEKATNNKYPYQKKDKDGKALCYGLCPRCENPVQLFGLVKKEKESMTPHGRHCLWDVIDIAPYVEKEVMDCPFYQGAKHEGDYHIDANDKTNKLFTLFLEHADAAFQVFSLTTGVVVTPNIWRSGIDSWFMNNKWRYYAANKATLPYIPFYPAEHIKLYGRVIRENSELFNHLLKLQKKYNLVFKKKYYNGNVQVDVKDARHLDLEIAIKEYECPSSGKQTFKLQILDTSLADVGKVIDDIKITPDVVLFEQTIESSFSNSEIIDYVSKKITPSTN